MTPRQRGGKRLLPPSRRAALVVPMARSGSGTVEGLEGGGGALGLGSPPVRGNAGTKKKRVEFDGNRLDCKIQTRLICRFLEKSTDF
jgi:hypothetical protein